MWGSWDIVEESDQRERFCPPNTYTTQCRRRLQQPSSSNSCPAEQDASGWHCAGCGVRCGIAGRTRREPPPTKQRCWLSLGNPHSTTVRLRDARLWPQFRRTAKHSRVSAPHHRVDHAESPVAVPAFLRPVELAVELLHSPVERVLPLDGLLVETGLATHGRIDACSRLIRSRGDRCCRDRR